MTLRNPINSTSLNPDKASLGLRELRFADLNGAAQLLGRGMCDNPVNVRAFVIVERERRCRALARFFVPVLRGLYRRGLIVGAFRDDVLIGVCGMARPGFCQPRLIEKLRVAPAVVFGNSVQTSLRVMTWVSEWTGRDPPDPHWHLGPVAVDARLRGQGIGGALVADFCRRMDDGATLSYLETDKSENVSFYQKLGFRVIAEATVLGIPNWFMSRAPLNSQP